MQNRVKFYGDPHGQPDHPNYAADSCESSEPERMVDAEQLLRILFEETSRPTLRWVRQMQVQRKIPYYKIGRLVRFRVSEVERALSQKCYVKAS